jgi:predicted metal-dependent hydrolase
MASRRTTTTTIADATGPSGEPVLVRRSARRTRTVSISRDDGNLVISIPAAFSRREEQKWVRQMIDQLAAKERRSTPRTVGDDELMEMARRLSGRYLDGKAVPASVRWTSRQQRRWGSCTPTTREIRLSDRLRSMPSWVLESVLVHELAHLLVDGHGPRFQALVDRYPRTERSRGFLDGVDFAEGMGPDADPPGRDDGRSGMEPDG